MINERKRRKFKLDDELKKLAMDWAEKTVNEIEIAFEDPSIAVKGETCKICEELKAWGWFERRPLGIAKNNDNQEKDNTMIYIYMLAMERYKKLKHEKDHPPKPKLSKWEKVTGRMNKS